jgi:hypothetical protein
MKKALVVVAVVVAAATLGAILIPAFSCPACLGASRAWGEPRPERPVWIGCPRCLSRGRVTGLNRLPRKSPQVASFAGATPQDLVLMFDRNHGPDGWTGDIRLVQAEGTTFAIIRLIPGDTVVPGTYQVRLCLVDSNVRLLETIDVPCPARQGALQFGWADPSRDDFVARIGSQEVTIERGRLTVKPQPPR